MTQGLCSRCGRALADDGSGCTCPKADEAGAGAWGGLDLKALKAPPREISRALREPSRALDEAGEFGEQSPGGEASRPLEVEAPRPRRDHRALRDPSRPLAVPNGTPPSAAGGPSPERRASPAAPVKRRADSSQLHPALRGSAPQARAARATAAKASAPERPAPAPLELDPSQSELGSRFSEAEQPDPGPQLELATEPAPVEAPAPRVAEQIEAPANDNASQQARKLAALAGYGPAPKKLLHALPYCVRVARRKRVLRVQLSARTLHRKQLEQTADNALVALGEALFAQRNDKRLTPLAPQLRAAAGANANIGSSVAAGKRVAQTRKRDFEALRKAADQRREYAAPIEARAQQVGERLARGRARIRELEARMQQLELEAKALKSATDPRTLAQLTALDLERQANLGEVQSLHVELLPLAEDHARLEAELAEHVAAVSQLQVQQGKLLDAVERDEQRKLVATGGARSAYRAALASLAQAAVRAELADAAPGPLAHWTAAKAPIADAQQGEQLVRTALTSYDHAAYARGLQLMAASVIGSFLFFTLMIAF